MADNTQEAGRRVHSAIGIALTTGADQDPMVVAKRACADLELSQVDRRAVLVQCATSLQVYLTRCHPEDAQLLGV